MLKNKQHYLTISNNQMLEEFAEALANNPKLSVAEWLEQPYKPHFTALEQFWAKLIDTLNCGGKWIMKDHDGLYLSEIEPQWSNNHWYITGKYFDISILANIFTTMSTSDCYSLDTIANQEGVL